MIKKLLVGIDFSDATPPVIEYAKNLALSIGVPLHLVHIIDEDSRHEIYGYTPGESRVLNFHIKKEEEKALSKMEALKDVLSNECSVTSNVLRGVITQSLVEEAEYVGADTVVLGTHGHGAMSTALFGSSPLRLIRRALINTIVIPIRS